MQNSSSNIFEPEKNISFTKELRFHPKLSFGERMFLGEIQAVISKRKDHKLYFSLHDLCVIFGISHATLKNWIHKLSKLGFIEVGVDYDKDKIKTHYLKSINKI